MNYILLPISKVIQLNEKTIIKIREIFKFDDWINNPSNMEVFKAHPGLQKHLEKGFDNIFNNPEIISIENFITIVTSAMVSFHVKLEEHLLPFYHVGDFKYETRDYDMVYLEIIEPKLAKRLPTFLYGVRIVPGMLHGASVITLETLQNTDLEKFRNSIELPEADDLLRGREPILDEIINGMREAQYYECDFFTYVG